MSELLSAFHFIRPWVLVLIPIMCALWYAWMRSVDPLKGWRQQIDPELLNAMADQVDGRENQRNYWLLAGWILAVIAIAGPTWNLEPAPFAEDAPPLFVLLKADVSMEQTDTTPSRLRRAQMKIADLARMRQGQPLGLIAYAGSAHLVLPPTKETSAVAEMAEQIRPDVMPEPGDRLDLATAKAVELLKRQDQPGSLLVMADTVRLDNAAINETKERTKDIPIQVLSMVPESSADFKNLNNTLVPLGAAVRSWTPDDADVEAIVANASHVPSGGVAGQSDHWQEAGYWLTPLLAILVALSFRRERNSQSEEQA